MMVWKTCVKVTTNRAQIYLQTVGLTGFSAEIWTWLWTRLFQKILTGFIRMKVPSEFVTHSRINDGSGSCCATVTRTEIAIHDEAIEK